MMLSASIVCARCQLKKRAFGADHRELCASLLTHAIAMHAANKVTGLEGLAHCDHAITILDFDLPPGDSKPLTIRCLAAGCRERAIPTEMSTECPRELVGALAIVFHASHEGHPLSLTWDGRTWESPRA